MLWTRRLVLLLLLALLFSACAHHPSSLNDDETVFQMRQEYLSTHPDGKYNPYIAKGEIVRGMNFLEVSASWGIPETRRLSQDEAFEYWTFFGQDDVSGDWTRYTLIFDTGTVTDWQMSRHFTKNGMLSEWGSASQGAAAPGTPTGTSGLGSTRR